MHALLDGVLETPARLGGKAVEGGERLRRSGRYRKTESQKARPCNGSELTIEEKYAGRFHRGLQRLCFGKRARSMPVAIEVRPAAALSVRKAAAVRRFGRAVAALELRSLAFAFDTTVRLTPPERPFCPRRLQRLLRID